MNGAQLSLVAGSGTAEGITFHFQDLQLTRLAKGSSGSGEIEKVYDLQHVLGTGNFASVRLGIKRATGEKVAVKIVDKKKFRLEPGLRPEQLQDEVAILRKLQHPNIVAVYDVYDTEDNMYLVMELCVARFVLPVLVWIWCQLWVLILCYASVV